MAFALHSVVSSLERIESLWEDCVDDIKELGHAVEETCTLWILVSSEGLRAKSNHHGYSRMTGPLLALLLREGNFPAFQSLCPIALTEPIPGLAPQGASSPVIPAGL